MVQVHESRTAWDFINQSIVFGNSLSLHNYENSARIGVTGRRGFGLCGPHPHQVDVPYSDVPDVGPAYPETINNTWFVLDVILCSQANVAGAAGPLFG